MKQLFAIRTLLFPVALTPPLFGYHAPLSAVILNEMLKNRGIFMAGNERHNDKHFTKILTNCKPTPAGTPQTGVSGTLLNRRGQN
jgi:hypothetical protein